MFADKKRNSPSSASPLFFLAALAQPANKKSLENDWSIFQAAKERRGAFIRGQARGALALASTV